MASEFCGETFVIQELDDKLLWTEEWCVLGTTCTAFIQDKRLPKESWNASVVHYFSSVGLPGMKWKWRREDCWDEGSIDAMPLSEAFDLFFLIHVERACDLQSVKEKLVSTTSGCSEPHFFQDTRDLDQIYDWLSAHKLPELHWDHMRPPSLHPDLWPCKASVCFFLSSLERKRELHCSGISSSCPVPWQHWTLGRLDLHETLIFFDSIWITSVSFNVFWFLHSSSSFAIPRWIPRILSTAG